MTTKKENQELQHNTFVLGEKSTAIGSVQNLTVINNPKESESIDRQKQEALNMLSDKIRTFYKKQMLTNPHLRIVTDLKDKFIETRLICKDIETSLLDILKQNSSVCADEFNPSLTDFLSLISMHDISISTPISTFWLLGEAGTGKTYGLLDSWRKLIEMGKNAIFIPLNMLSSKVTIESYLEAKIFTGDFTRKWRDLLSLEHREEITPLILMLDGFNELDSLNQEQQHVIAEIEGLISELNIIVCVSSRRVDNLKFIVMETSERFEIKPLSREIIESYVSNTCKASQVLLTDNLLQLLKTPLMLALYCESSDYYYGDKHRAFPCVEYILGEPSESTIIWNYLQCMVSKAFDSKLMSSEKRFSYIVLIRYIAPFVGQYMQTNNIFRLPVTKARGKSEENDKQVKVFDDLFDAAVEYYECIKGFSEIKILQRECGVMKVEAINASFLRQIAVNDLGLFVKSDYSIVLFHQSIRDCLSAIHYINDVKFSTADNFPILWAKSDIKREVALVKHISELDKKLQPDIEFENVNQLWENLRGVSPIYQETANSIREILDSNLNNNAYINFSHHLVSNCVTVYKHAYNSDFSKLDFTGIDLSHTPMNEFIFTNNDSSATFGNCAIGRNTFFINGHSEDESILSVAFNNKILLSRSDRSLRVWDIDTSKCIDVLLASEEIVDVPFLDVDFNSYIFKCVYSDGKVIYEYSFEDARSSIFNVCDDVILSVAYSPNGKMIVCTDTKNNVYLFDVYTKDVICRKKNDSLEFNQFENNVFNRPFLHCNCSDKYIAYINEQDKCIHLIDIDSKKDIPLPNSFYNDYTEVVCIRFSEEISLCAVLIDKSITIYSLLDLSIKYSQKQDSSCTDVAFSSNGKYFALCTEDKCLSLYETKKIMEKDAPISPDSLSGNGIHYFGSFRTLTFYENQPALFIGDDSGKIHKIRKADDETYLSHFDGKSPAVFDFDITKDEKFIVATYSDGAIKKWNLANGFFDSDFLTKENYGSANCVRYSQKNDFIVAGFSNGVVCFWNAESNEFMFELNNEKSVSCMTITNDDNYIICACFDGSIHVWDIDKKREVCQPSSIHTKQINSLLLYECSEYSHLISVSNDGLALMWNFDVSTAEPLSLYKEVKKSNKWIRGLTLFDDTDKFVKFAVFSDDGHLIEYKMDDGTLINDIELEITNTTLMFGFSKYYGENASSALGYSEDGRRIAISYSSYLEGSSGIQIIDIDKNEFSNPVPFYKYDQYLEYIIKLRYLIVGSNIVFCSIRGDIIVINSATFQPIFPKLLLDSGFSDKLDGCDLSNIVDINGIAKHFVGNDIGNKEFVLVDIENLFATEAANFLDGVVLNPFNYIVNDSDIEKWVYHAVSVYAKNNPIPIPQKHIELFIDSIAGYLFHEAPLEEQNVYMIAELIRSAETNKESESDLDKLFNYLGYKKPNAVALKKYRKYRKLNSNIQTSVLAISHRIFSPVIYDKSDVLCHAKTFDDLPRIALSFVSNSKTTPNNTETGKETTEIFIDLEVSLLTIVFTYMLTETDINKRTAKNTIDIIGKFNHLLTELKFKHPEHLALLMFEEFMENVDAILFQNIISCLIERFYAYINFFASYYDNPTSS